MPITDVEGTPEQQLARMQGAGGGQGDPEKEQFVDPALVKEVEANNKAEEIDEENDANGDDEVDEVDEEGDNDDEDEAEGSDEEEPEEAKNKSKKSVQSRINELTRERHEAERSRDYWRTKALEAQRSVNVGIRHEEPDPSRYEYGEADPAYYRDLARHEAKIALDEERNARAQNDYSAALNGAFEATISKGRAVFADFDQKVLEGASNGSWDCSEELALQIIDSEKGEEIAYFLAMNPAEARRMSALPSRSLAREIGKLEFALEQPQSVKPKVVSDLPPPPKRTSKGSLRGSGGFDPETASMEDFDKFYHKVGNRRR